MHSRSIGDVRTTRAPRMDRAVLLTVVALGAFVVGACSDSSVPAPETLKATTVRIVAGDSQKAAVATALPAALTVEVRDQHGNLMPGATVTFTASSGSVGVVTGVTDSTGITSTTLTLGDAAGAYTVTAAVTGLQTPLTFDETGIPGPAQDLVDAAGNGQAGAEGATLTTPLVVEVLDLFGNPVAGVQVTWSSPNGGVLSTTTSLTDETGHASAFLTLPAQAETVQVVAHVDNVGDTVFSEISQ